MARETTPFIFTHGETVVSVPITAGVPGGNPAIFPSSDLVNPLSVPIEVTELHFEMDEPRIAVGPASFPTFSGEMFGALEIDLRCGRYALTNGYVPLIAMGLRREYLPVELVGSNPAVFALSPIGADTVRWVLPRPFIVGPRESFAGSIRLNTTMVYDVNLTGNVRVNFTARGRRMPPGSQVPAVRCVPWASGQFFTAAGMGLQGDNKSFLNVHRVPLRISSINMRRRRVQQEVDPLVSLVTPGGLARTVRREGGTLVNGLGMSAQRYSFEERFTLDPNDAVRIVIGPSPGAVDPTTGMDPSALAVVMQGYREE